MKNYKIENQPMISASHEAEIRKFHKYTGKTWTWYVADQPNAADNIYCWRPGPSEGFGGRVISFTLINGEIDGVAGPWHSNSNGLFLDTGIDIRNKHLTFGVIGQEYNNGQIINVIHQDEDWVIGTFVRIHDLAKQLAKERSEILYYYQVTAGGSSRGRVLPNDLL
jgi:hypothetical protein